MLKQNQEHWEGIRVVVVGAARQGTALARYLFSQGAQVIINDRRSAEELGEPMKGLSDLPIKWILGDHPSSILDNTDLLCLSGGVPLSIPFVTEATQRGIPLSNDSQIFLEDSKCKNVIGITGSAGKTTTTSLVGEIAKKTINDGRQPDHYRKSWVGGNIGKPLIALMDNIEPDDLVVMELSSFQLEIMSKSPWMAVILNISPNHLDRHGTMEAYSEAKSHILVGQGGNDIAVLNRDDEETWRMKTRVIGNIVSFGKGKPDELPGSFISGNWIHYEDHQACCQLMPVSEIKLRGQHNLSNILAAVAIACAANLPGDAIRSAIVEFTGVPHRLEFIRMWGGAAWYNDSIATAPERALAAIRSFDEPLVLLAGGRDKNLPWEELLRVAIGRLRYFISFGESAAKIEAILKSLPGNQNLPRVTCKNLKEAVEVTANLVREGDVVLLSPGGTSFDEFMDFEERGAYFRKWVLEL